MLRISEFSACGLLTVAEAPSLPRGGRSGVDSLPGGGRARLRRGLVSLPLFSATLRSSCLPGLSVLVGLLFGVA